MAEGERAGVTYLSPTRHPGNLFPGKPDRYNRSEGQEIYPMFKRAYTPVDPVIHDGIRYEEVHDRTRFGQYGGVLGAYDAATGEELWALKLFDVEYEEAMEQDVQDVFLTRLGLGDDGSSLHLSNERGEAFVVDLVERSVRRLR